MGEIKDAVIVAYGRSAIGRGKKGSLKDTHPVDFAGQVLKGVLSKLPELDTSLIDDSIIGCSKCEQVQGYNIARLIGFRAGLPDSVPATTINRFCSSGLQAISVAANLIRTGDAEVVIAGGVETMSMLPMGTDPSVRSQWILENKTDAYMPMGITAENVAEKCDVTREEMDRFAMESHQKAKRARDEGRFKKQIIPVEIVNDAGEKVIFETDEGIRDNVTMESLSMLKPCFKEDGNVTAATSSQVSDGSGMVVMMSTERAIALGIKPIAKFVGYKVVGLNPALMGLGPTLAVPKVLELTNLKIEDMDVIELNEAFAAQAIPSILQTGMDPAKVNPNGGAIAMGHPLGATGAILTCKLLAELERINGRYGMVTMCIGGGMGAAGIFEML